MVRPRNLILRVKMFGGFPMDLGEISIVKFADLKKAKTVRICPRCGTKPHWDSKYLCTCCPLCGKLMDRRYACPVCGNPMETQEKLVQEEGKEKKVTVWVCPYGDGEQTSDKTVWVCENEDHGQQEPSTYKHFSQLLAMTEDGEPIVKEKQTDGKSTIIAEVSTMPIDEYAEKHADAELATYSFIAKTEDTAVSIKKLLIANRNLGMVIVLRYTDTYGETRILLLTESMSKRLLLKEVMPEDLAEIRPTMKADLTKLTEEEIEEARNLIKMIPKATDETFRADDKDYRLTGIDREIVSAKVQKLEELIAEAKRQKLGEQIVA